MNNDYGFSDGSPTPLTFDVMSVAPFPIEPLHAGSLALSCAHMRIASRCLAWVLLKNCFEIDEISTSQNGKLSFTDLQKEMKKAQKYFP